SYVGRINGPQEISLDDRCVHNGIIQHEFIHVLNFWHEQSRSDRDVYVRINLENVLDGYERNFNKRETNNLEVPYDYSSVMHYGPKTFSKNSEDTITPLMSSVEIGQRIGMSENDILKINKLYDC
ncbi:high choriolytic enzyme 1-like, partial [Plectropomus leopardus]|uniref:high choriolytic enzyme 1-like n=1 Tax=Plectropomus leopardus TaxID=160734 RepID=UPI001C4CEA11